ncbi:MAG: dihydropteroate synthase, partial [Proteobacteria bacterium SW_6_67_9]
MAPQRALLIDRLAGESPLVMGVLNITPDSFSDGGL